MTACFFSYFHHHKKHLIYLLLMSYFLYKQASQTTTDIQYVSYRIFCKKHIENQKKQIREANHPLFININSLSNLTLYNYEHSNDSILSISMLNLKNTLVQTKAQSIPCEERTIPPLTKLMHEKQKSEIDKHLSPLSHLSTYKVETRVKKLPIKKLSLQAGSYTY